MVRLLWNADAEAEAFVSTSGDFLEGEGGAAGGGIDPSVLVGEFMPGAIFFLHCKLTEEVAEATD